VTDGWDAVILAGGAGERLGGVSKAELVVGGLSLLERSLAAVAGARRVAIVGGPRYDGALWTVEDPPGGGPAPGVVAGLRALADGRVPSEWTLVIAVDTPAAADAVPTLLAARAGDGAWVVDADGREQPLLALYRTAAISAHADAQGAPMRRLVGGLDMVVVADPSLAAHDVDTWDDVDFWKERLG